MTLVGDGLDGCRASRERTAPRIVLDMAAQATGAWLLYDDFFEDRFLRTNTYGITRFAALQDFVGLHRVGFAVAHEYEVVEDALGRQRDVHDLGEVHLENGQEEFHGRAADLEVFPRRDADDGGIKRS